jgi:putative peptidoglycan lipid II flippase
MRRAQTTTGRGRQRSAARDSVTVAGWTLVSRVTGLLRVVFIGAVLGPTYFANIFQTGYVLPNLIYSLIAGQILAMVVVPGVVRALTGQGLSRAKEVLGRLSGILITASAALAGLLALASPLLAWTLTFGVPDDAGRARAQHLAIIIIVFVAPQVVLYTVAALHTAAQQARGRFAIAAGAPAVENAGVMATMVVAAVMFGGGLGVAEVPMGLVVLLGAGSTLSVAAHALLQVYGAARAGVATRPSLAWRGDSEVIDLLRRLRRSVRIAACQAGGMYVVLALAATVPGGVFVLQVVFAVHNAVIALGSHAVSTAVLPRLSTAAQQGDLAGFAAHWRRGLSYAAMVGLPAMALIAVFAWPAAGILTRGEANQDVVVGQLTLCLMVVAATQLAGGMHNLGRQALFARLDVRGPRTAAAVELAVTAAVGCLALLLLPPGTSRLVVLALAIVAGEAAGAIIVLLRLRTAFGSERFVDVHALSRTGAAVLVMLPAAAGGRWWLDAADTSGALHIVLMSLCGAAAIAVYAAVLRASGQPTGAEHRHAA